MASPDAYFQTLMNDMKVFNNKNAEYLEGTGTQRRWMIPTQFTTFKVFDIQNLSTPFDRTQLNADYKAEYEGTGDDEIRSVAGYSTQIAYLAMMERAFRERYKSLPRIGAHTMGRVEAHGEDDGVHEGSILPWVQELFTA